MGCALFPDAFAEFLPKAHVKLLALTQDQLSPAQLCRAQPDLETSLQKAGTHAGGASKAERRC